MNRFSQNLIPPPSPSTPGLDPSVAGLFVAFVGIVLRFGPAVSRAELETNPWAPKHCVVTLVTKASAAWSSLLPRKSAIPSLTHPSTTPPKTSRSPPASTPPCARVRDGSSQLQVHPPEQCSRGVEGIADYWNIFPTRRQTLFSKKVPQWRK